MSIESCPATPAPAAVAATAASLAASQERKSHRLFQKEADGSSRRVFYGFEDTDIWVPKKKTPSAGTFASPPAPQHSIDGTLPQAAAATVQVSKWKKNTAPRAPLVPGQVSRGRGRPRKIVDPTLPPPAKKSHKAANHAKARLGTVKLELSDADLQVPLAPAAQPARHFAATRSQVALGGGHDKSNVDGDNAPRVVLVPGTAAAALMLAAPQPVTYLPSATPYDTGAALSASSLGLIRPAQARDDELAIPPWRCVTELDQLGRPTTVHPPTSAQAAPRYRLMPGPNAEKLRDEDLSDDRFTRRHHALAFSERKRRKWGSFSTRFAKEQQMRKDKEEQQRLREGRAASPPASASASTSSSSTTAAAAALTADSIDPSQPTLTLDALADLTSFWPSVAALQVGRLYPRLFIEVSDSLPVAAFGATFPVLPPTPFSLPDDFLEEFALGPPTPIRVGAADHELSAAFASNVRTLRTRQPAPLG